MAQSKTPGIIHLAVATLLFGLLLPAQQQTGSMIGTVVDPSGSSVPGAEVSVKNTGTGATFTATTDASGLWRAPQLNPGTYDISVAAKGFSTVVRTGVEVRVADRLRIDFALQVGAVNDTVTITGTSPLLQVEDASLGQVVDNRTMVELPLNGRNWQQLATLTPATVSGPTGPVNIGGLRTNQQQYLLDGADNTNLIAGGVAFSPPIDALQEFKVQTSNFTADTAGFSGAVLNATVKSGTNSLHGNAYEFLRNRSLNARNFFALPTAPKPQLNRNNYGASIGGPIVRNKVFFFFNYDALSQRQANTTSTTVFTDAQKRGDFSSTLGSRVGTDAAGNTVAAGQIFNPFSLHTVNGTLVRDPFPGNIVPDNLINPVSRKLINLVPQPVLPGSPNYIVSVSAPVDNKNYLGRVDWTQSAKNNVYGHVGYTSGLQTAACIFSLPVCGATGNGLNTTSENYQISAGWTHIFSPTTINEFTAGNTRTVSTRDLLGADTDYNGQYGIPFPFQGPHMGSLAFLGITGYTGIGSAAAGGPYFQFVNKFELADNVTVIRGKHGLKFGFNGRLKLFHNQWSSNFGHGAENFTGIYTRQIGFPTSGNAIADYLLGVANDASFGNIVHEKDIWRDIEAYVQDKWAVTSRLTVSLGIRYFNNPPSWEARDQVASVLTGPGYHNPVIVVPNGVDKDTFNFVANTLFPFMPVRRAPELNRGMVYPIHGSWAPRLGIAYQLSKKTVVRTGFGVFYGFPEQVGGNILGVNPPSRLVLNNTSDGINPTIFIDKAAFGATPFNRALNNPPGDFLSIRDPYSPPEMTLMYNFSIQHEFLPGWLAEVGYTGNTGRHIYVNTSINDAVPALPTDNSSIQSRRIATPLLGNLPFYAPQGSSIYNALTLNLEKRFAHGFSVLTNYTFSRALGNTDAAAKSPYDLRDSYGPLSFDVRNHFVFSGVWDLPFGKGRPFFSNIPAIANQLVGGWELTGIATLQGGTRATPSLSFSLGRTTTNSRPDIVGDPTQGAARQPYNWINPAAFAVPTNAQIAAGDFFGNSGAGIIANPGLVNFDISAMKNFSIKERVRVQFRAEFFNATNTPYFGGLGTVVGTPNFGKLTSASDPRVVQLGLKVVF